MTRDLQRAIDAFSFGGDGFLQVDFTRWPVDLRIRVDADRVLTPIGYGVATAVKKRIRKGLAAEGKPMPKPQDAERRRRTRDRRRKRGRPLIRTGDLVGSIRYNRRKKLVHPVGFRKDLGHKLRSRRESLLWVLIHTSKHRTSDGKKIDPLGVDREIQKVIQKRGEQAIARELDRPGYGLVAEMKRLKR